MRSIQKLFLTTLVLIFCSAVTLSQSINNWEHTSRLIDSICERYSIPGTAIAVVTKDTTLFSYCRGYADIQDSNKVTPNTLFRVSSISKSFLGLAFLKLEEDGLINLDTPVIEIAPEIRIQNKWQATDPVRVRHLLEHTAGFNDLHFSNYDTEDPDVPLRVGLDRTWKDRRVRWRPGTVYSYSSGGYALAGYILEKITGIRYDEYIENKILQPMEMTSSFIKWNQEKANGLAKGYGQNYRPIPYPHVYARPAASLNTSLSEMTVFLRFLLSPTDSCNRIFESPAPMKEFVRPKSSIAARNNFPIGYSMGIGSYNVDGILWYGHNGSDPGYASVYMYSPLLETGYVILTNRFDKSAMSGIVRLKETITSAIYPSPDEKDLSCDTLFSFEEKFHGVYRVLNSRQTLFQWMDYLVGCKAVVATDSGLILKDFIGSDAVKLINRGNNRYSVGNCSGSPLMFFEGTGKEKPVLIINHDYYEKTSSAGLITGLIVAGIVVLIMTIVLLLYPCLAVAALIRVLRKKTGIALFKWMHSLFWALVLLFTGLSAFAALEMEDMGRKNFPNILFQWSTILFLVLTYASALGLIKLSDSGMNRAGKIVFAICSSVLMLTALFLLVKGLIGLRFWAF